MLLKLKNLKFLLVLVAFFCCSFNMVEEVDSQPVYKYRKYNHVKKFYKRLSVPVTKLCIEYKVPPAVVLSILSLESGWGKGYVGNITGNFLSLNASKGRKDTALPALRMPKLLKTGEYIIDRKRLATLDKSEYVWENRPSSLKKDYRPKGMAGTKENLDYFLNHPEELTEANLKNVKDFLTHFISKDSGIRAYRQARALLDKEIAEHGIEVLFTDDLSTRFVYTIGGRPSSYNTRKSWPRKVMSIYKHVGANELCKQVYLDKKSFEEAW